MEAARMSWLLRRVGPALFLASVKEPFSGRHGTSGAEVRQWLIALYVACD